MKVCFVKWMIAFFLVFIWAQQSIGQDLTGIWRGYFISSGFEQYKLEVQIKQASNKSISGVTYSYLTTVFYGKATMSGVITSSTSVILQEIKTVELRMSAGSVACIMKYQLEYSKSGREEFLEGSYTSKYEKTDKNSAIRKGEGCGGGTVYLRKVTTSDFYVEPFLRDNPAQKKPLPPADNPVAKSTPAKPPANTKPVTKPPVKTPQQKTTTTKPATKNPPAVTKPKTDTVKKITAPPVAQKEAKSTVPPPTIIIPNTTRSRPNELLQTIDVSSNQITVRLYDNGEIDDDTISVYLDNQLVLARKRLSAVPLTLTLTMNTTQSEHILVMVAENLGRIPPNTSLMIVQDGDKRYQVRITSTEQKNAMVRFRFNRSDE